MKKTLYDLTKEDWNTLFPIELVPHNPNWKGTYEKEQQRIMDHMAPGIILRMEHFGSSAIPAIKSKPYIDILIGVSPTNMFSAALIDQFTALGYTHFKVPDREHIPAYSSFAKGYQLDGKKAQIFHIHLCPINHVMWQQTAFRDYLNAHPVRAKEYEELKMKLADANKHDRGAYVLGKTQFVEETLTIIQENERVY